MTAVCGMAQTFLQLVLARIGEAGGVPPGQSLRVLLGNLFGIGLGPLLTGFFSDTLARTAGSADGLRYALMIMSCLFLLVGIFALRSARHIARDRED